MKSTALHLLLHPFVQGRLAISSPISSKLCVFYRILLLPEVTFVFHRWANAFCQRSGPLLNHAHIFPQKLFSAKRHQCGGDGCPFEVIFSSNSLEAHGGQQFETAGVCESKE